MVARKDLRSFVGLLARCVPLDVVSGRGAGAVFRSVEEVEAELEARGIDARLPRPHGREHGEQRAKANGGGTARSTAAAR